ncbi:hypothetical protein K488DRAFT_18677, partial [Vararia minispora EC-137]
VAGLATVARAHFQLQYPPPRGPFVDTSEVNFCDDYVNAGNRTAFPLSNGFVTLNVEHPSWNIEFEISTVQNPTTFTNFTSGGQEQIVRQFASATGEGVFCIPLPLNNTGVSGVQDGANVTILIIFNGGDGALYQCADLTLSNTATIPSNITCSNATSSGSSSSSSNSSSNSTTNTTGSSAA